MSLTSNLNDRNSPVRRFMEETFPKTRALHSACRQKMAQANTLLPPSPLPYGTIGMALDYRIRYYFCITPFQQLVAFYGARRANSLHPKSGEVDFYTDAFALSLQETLEKIQPVRRRLEVKEECQIARYCVILALLEQIVRAHLFPSPLIAARATTIEELLDVAEPHWVEDLCHLSWRFHDQFSHLLTKPDVVLNPIFVGGVDVGGATQSVAD